MKQLIVAALLLAGCRSEANERPAPPQKTIAPRAAEPWSCGAIHDGAKVTRHGLGEPGRAIRIGLVADPIEALPATLGNLERFAQVFQKDRVSAVVALGGLGSTEEEIAKVLLALKGAGAPVFALPGDRAPEPAFHAGVARARKAGLDVTDLAKARAVAGDGLAILSLPGYRFTHYLAAGEAGCRYDAADVRALAALDGWLASRPERPILFVAHAPPRGNGPDALDWALGGANVGDPDLAKVLPSLHAKVAAFAHVDEAGGRSSDGKAPLAAGAWAARLWVNVGAADSVPHEMLPGGLGHGQAMLVEIAGGRARAQVIP